VGDFWGSLHDLLIPVILLEESEPTIQYVKQHAQAGGPFIEYSMSKQKYSRKKGLHTLFE
jgi:hypothetical protein